MCFTYKTEQIMSEAAVMTMRRRVHTLISLSKQADRDSGYMHLSPNTHTKHTHTKQSFGEKVSGNPSLLSP